MDCSNTPVPVFFAITQLPSINFSNLAVLLVQIDWKRSFIHSSVLTIAALSKMRICWKETFQIVAVSSVECKDEGLVQPLKSWLRNMLYAKRYSNFLMNIISNLRFLPLFMTFLVFPRSYFSLLPWTSFWYFRLQQYWISVQCLALSTDVWHLSPQKWAAIPIHWKVLFQCTFSLESFIGRLCNVSQHEFAVSTVFSLIFDPSSLISSSSGISVLFAWV